MSLWLECCGFSVRRCRTTYPRYLKRLCFTLWSAVTTFAHTRRFVVSQRRNAGRSSSVLTLLSVQRKHSGSQWKWGKMRGETEALEFRKSQCVGVSPRRKRNGRTKKRKRERKREWERESESATLSLSMIQRAGISFLWGFFIFFWSGNQWSLSRSEGSALHRLCALRDHCFRYFFITTSLRLFLMCSSPPIREAARGQFKDARNFIGCIYQQIQFLKHVSHAPSRNKGNPGDCKSISNG